MKRKILTFGTFDLFHYGHLRILQRARELGDYLIVGISTDELNMCKKSRNPIFSYNQRESIIRGLRCVNETFPEESLDLKKTYIEKYKPDLLVMGDDWKGAFDDMGVDVVYLERTPEISTTFYINNIQQNI